MDDLMDMIIGDESPANISDKIKDVLYTKASERVDDLRSPVAGTVFGDEEESVETEEE
jgi:hypothetical protein